LADQQEDYFDAPKFLRGGAAARTRRKINMGPDDAPEPLVTAPLIDCLMLDADMPVPKVICVGWYSLDVLFTSSTICHLCMISVDRYMSLTYPLRYGHAKKKKHTIMKIALVWIVSFCIAGPLFVLSMWDEHLDAVVVGKVK